MKEWSDPSLSVTAGQSPWIPPTVPVCAVHISALTSSRSCLTSSTSSSSTSVRNSPVWSMELMKSCSRRCLLLTLLLHLSVRGQKESEHICRPAEIQRHTRLLHLSHTDLWHTLTSHTNTGQNSSYRPNHTLLEWRNNARNNRDLRDAV